MKVVIQHPSGAIYQGPHRFAEEWWSRFSVTHPQVEPEKPEDEEPPAVVGLDGNWSGAQDRDHEYDSAYGHNMPVVSAKTTVPFGFVRNEENAK